MISMVLWGFAGKLSPEVGEGSYWTYGQRDLFDIKIHNFSFNKDFMLEFDLPECLSITRYDSISGEELSSVSPVVSRMYQDLCGRIQAISSNRPQKIYRFDP